MGKSNDVSDASGVRASARAGNKKHKRRRKLGLAIGIILLVVAVLIIFESLPYSPLKQQWESDMSAQDLASANVAANTSANASEFANSNTTITTAPADGAITQASLASLPAPLQKYFTVCGLIGMPLMSEGSLEMRGVDFRTQADGPHFDMTYDQTNYVAGCARLVYMDTSMFGIPFEGLDSYYEGSGGMHGVLGKVVTLFNQTGPEMDASELVTWLGESLFLVPSAVFSPNIKWTSVDNNTVKATLCYNDITVSGDFIFDDSGRLIRFETDDRYESVGNGYERNHWMMEFSAYHDVDGVQQPGHCKVTWQYTDGRADFTYFDGDVQAVMYE
jgi:hypothetical protein